MQLNDKTALTGSVARIDSRTFAASVAGVIVTVSAAKAAASYCDAPVMVFLLPAAVFALLWFYASDRRWVATTAAALALLVTTALLSNWLPDPTWDGNMYHKVALVALHDGWNPWRFPEFSDWLKTQSALEYSDSVWSSNIAASWISHYPNISWLFGAALMDYGFAWESTKAISTMLTVAIFFRSFSVFRQWIGRRATSGMLAACVVLCQPLLAQITTNYVDGITYALFVLIMLALLDEKRATANRITVWCSLILLAGLKFTGALYGVLLAIPFLFVYRPRFREMLLWGTIGLATLSHPYLNHVVSGLPVGYPVTTGSQILSGQAEQAMLDQSRPQSLLTSLFSKVSNDFAMPGLKVPGSVRSQEISMSGVPDTRYSGFGPLFSLAALLGLVAAAASAVQTYRKNGRRDPTWRLYACIGFLLALTLIHAAPWWARYVPFLQFALIIALLASIRIGPSWARGVAIAGAFVLIVNGAMILIGVGSYIGRASIDGGVAVDRQIIHRHLRGESVLIRAPAFMGFPAIYHAREVLHLSSIEYQAVSLDKLDCGGREELGTWIGLVKFCRGQEQP